jgi:hypothetical protein
MTANRSGPVSVATEVEALVTDLLDGTIDTKSNTATDAKQGNGFYRASTIKPKRHRRTSLCKNSYIREM